MSYVESRVKNTGERSAQRRYPNEAELEKFLATTLSAAGFAPDEPLITARDRSGRYSTYTNEIVTCRLAAGDTVRLLCKYAGSNSHPGFGHRRGIDYEVSVYRDVLSRMALSTPRYFGHRFDPATEEHWLALEYIEGGKTINKGPQPATMISAAQWIGRFHALGATVLDTTLAGALIQYDCEYFTGWAPRAKTFAEPLRDAHPWFGDLCDRAADFIPGWMALPRTLIHGEYTVHNVLLRDPLPTDDWMEIAAGAGDIAIAPIDWESAAISFGEIDLAFLLDGTWPEDVRATCAAAYRQARWGATPPADFEDRFRAAQLYMHLRWLGDSSRKTLQPKSALRFEQLLPLGLQLGLI